MGLANRLANGDLRIVTNTEGSDETHQLLRAMKHMVDKWREVVGQVTSTAASLLGGHTSLRRRRPDVKRVSHPSRKGDDCRRLVEEMSQTVLDVARNAGEISKSATVTAGTARDGGAVVDRAVQEVGRSPVRLTNRPGS